jgi:hypothetical protein
MMWALVPLIPKADTPVRRGRPLVFHATGSVSSRTSPAVQSTCGEGTSACRVAGSRPFLSARTILMTPAAPAACWACPMFDFTDPSHSGRPSGRSCP